MLRVTLRGIRAHISRLVAVTLAAAIAVAFLSATFILNSTTSATLRTSLGQSYARADLIVALDSTYSENPANSTDLSTLVPKLAAINGVQAAFGQATISAVAEGRYVTLSNAAPASLNTLQLQSGRMPETAGEVVIEADFATSQNLVLGNPIELGTSGYTSTPNGDASPETGVVVGIASKSQSPADTGTPILTITNSALQALGQRWYGNAPSPNLVQLSFVPESNRSAITAEVKQVAELPGVQVLTPDQYVSQQIDRFTGGFNILLIAMLVFVAIALFVAGLVISNTFSVLVAQRSRELALLRCIGASTRQVFRSVLLEALAVGLAASVAGVLLAFGIMSALVAWGRSAMNTNLTFGSDWQAIIWPVLVGVTIVLFAATGPARGASRVAPISALRPTDAPTMHTRIGKLQGWFGLALLGIGAALLVWAAFGFADATDTDTVIAPALAVLGAILSFIGLLVLLKFTMPAIVLGFSRLARSENIPVRIAGLNGARNPRRTASTAGALLIGVTLVTTVYVGGSVAQATFDRQLDAHYPIDLQISSFSNAYLPEFEADGSYLGAIPVATLSAEQLADIAAITGVQQVESLPAAYMNVSTNYGASSVLVAAATSEQWSQVSPIGAEALAAGTALLPVGSAIQAPLVLQNGSHSVTLTEFTEATSDDLVVLSPEQFMSLRLDQSPGGSDLGLGNVGLLKLEPNLSADAVQHIVEQITAIVPQANISGAATIRAIYNQIIQTLMLIITGLLAVAVLIAVIGIGNTLALSVIERTRENALLRALGMTRGGLLAMLSAEAVLIAVSAAAVGVLLGVAYGYLGSAALLSPMGQASFALPLIALVIVVLAAVASGFVASLLPARRATRLSPIQGLAIE